MLATVYALWESLFAPCMCTKMLIFCSLNTGIEQVRYLHGGSVFYVTGTTKQELFNTAEKMKESSVDDLSNCDLKTLSISPPDTSPDSFHEVPVDCPEEVPIDVPEGKNLSKPVEVHVTTLYTHELHCMCTSVFKFCRKKCFPIHFKSVY